MQKEITTILRKLNFDPYQNCDFEEIVDGISQNLLKLS